MALLLLLLLLLYLYMLVTEVSGLFFVVTDYTVSDPRGAVAATGPPGYSSEAT